MSVVLLSVLLPGKFHRQRNLAGYNPQGCKSRLWLSTNTQTRVQLPSLWCFVVVAWAKTTESPGIETNMLSLTVLPSASCSLPIFNKTRIIVVPIPDGSGGKASACRARDPGSIPGLGRSPEEGNGNPLQYSGQENPMDRGAWQAIVRGVAKSQTWLSD